MFSWQFKFCMTFSWQLKFCNQYLGTEKNITMSSTTSANKDRLQAAYTNSNEWLSQNETRLGELWESLKNYLRHNNSFILDKCDYVTFCDFVAHNSTHYDDRH